MVDIIKVNFIWKSEGRRDALLKDGEAEPDDPAHQEGTTGVGFRFDLVELAYTHTQRGAEKLKTAEFLKSMRGIAPDGSWCWTHTPSVGCDATQSFTQR